jgi:SAM-dependent methyltransferase
VSDCLACERPLPESGAIRTTDRQGVAQGEFEVRICSNCGGGTTLPPASAGELSGFYPREYGPHARSGASGPLARATMAARLRTRLFRGLEHAVPNGAGPRALLDVGAGSGDLGGVLASRGWRVVGVEPSPAACELARGRGVDARQGTLETVELGEDGFDAVVFHHSLEHVTDPVAALRRARDLLRPGGAVAIAVPNFGSPQARALGADWWALDVPRHRFHFTGDALATALDRAGLAPSWMRPTASVLGPAANAQQRRTGRMETSGPRFLAGYGLALAAYPVRWAMAEARGQGEFLSAIAVRA